jgi:acetyl-CoA carboxylase biotin carboxyl carrier protein
MDSQQVEMLAKTMSEYGVYELEIIDPQGSKIHLKRSKPVEISSQTHQSVPVVEKPKEKVIEDTNLEKISSPLVGTFYSASSPEEENFVNVGQQIKVGQTVGIVEAMKLMNEITSEVSGVVEKVLVENEQPVQFNQPLFTIRKN